MKWPWQKPQEPEVLRPSETATIRISIGRKKDAEGQDRKCDDNPVVLGMEPQDDERTQLQTTGKEKPPQIAKRIKIVSDITKEVVVVEGDRMWREPYVPPKKDKK